MLVVVAGIYLVNLESLRPRTLLDAPRMLLRPGGRYAALTGVLIASYTMVDKQGVAVVNPLTYVYLTWVIAAAMLAPPVLARYGRRPWRRVQVCARDVTLVAILWVAAYLLVLIALTLAPNPLRLRRPRGQHPDRRGPGYDVTGRATARPTVHRRRRHCRRSGARGAGIGTCEQSSTGNCPRA